MELYNITPQKAAKQFKIRSNRQMFSKVLAVAKTEEMFDCPSLRGLSQSKGVFQKLFRNRVPYLSSKLLTKVKYQQIESAIIPSVKFNPDKFYKCIRISYTPNQKVDGDVEEAKIYLKNHFVAVGSERKNNRRLVLIK